MNTSFSFSATSKNYNNLEDVMIDTTIAIEEEIVRLIKSNNLNRLCFDVEDYVPIVIKGKVYKIVKMNLFDYGEITEIIYTLDDNLHDAYTYDNICQMQGYGADTLSFPFFHLLQSTIKTLAK